MKKIFAIVLFTVASLFLVGTLVFANDSGVADVVIHFQSWEGEYDEIGAHLFEAAIPDTPNHKKLSDDDFGARFEFKNMDLNKSLGFIAVKGQYDSEDNFTQDWDHKYTQNVMIKGSDLVKDQVNHVYVFEGAATNATNPAYFVAKNDQANLLVLYADPSGSYEENLGVHAWDGWDKVAPDWGTPAKVFSNGASHGAIPVIKGAMMHTTNKKAAFLIYAGDDATKKTGDVKISSAFDLAEDEELVMGSVAFAYIYSKGNGYTENDNVTYGTNDEFLENAFSFRILPMGRDDRGSFTGSYAPKANQLIIELSSAVASPMWEKVGEENKQITDKAKIEAALNTVKSWFTIKDTSGAVLEIEQVDFNHMEEAVKKFVIIFKKDFDITKDYTVYFDLKIQDQNLNRNADLEINLDREKPTISFISNSDFNDLETNERIIIVEWNKKFNRQLFPTFTASDDRDGTITSMVYVPEGENSTLNTNVLGDYKITLRVEDSWGNYTEETFIFRVEKKAK